MGSAVGESRLGHAELSSEILCLPVFGIEEFPEPPDLGIQLSFLISEHILDSSDFQIDL